MIRKPNTSKKLFSRSPHQLSGASSPIFLATKLKTKLAIDLERLWTRRPWIRMLSNGSKTWLPFWLFLRQCSLNSCEGKCSLWVWHRFHFRLPLWHLQEPIPDFIWNKTSLEVVKSNNVFTFDNVKINGRKRYQANKLDKIASAVSIFGISGILSHELWKVKRRC